MNTPSAVIWGCTKKFSNSKVQQKGARSRNECFNSGVMNLTGLHNQSACTSEYGLTGNKVESASKKGSRNVLELTIAHKEYHHAKKSKVLSDKTGQAGLAYSTVTIKKGSAHAAKTIKGMNLLSNKKRALLLSRLAKLHGATRSVKA